MPVVQSFDRLIGNTGPVRALVAEITAAGAIVECFPGGKSPHTGNGDMFATADWHRSDLVWRIYYPVACHAHQVYHELAHVYRHRVDGVPILVATAGADPVTSTNLSELKNDFDHAHVVPKEVSTYPEAADYWSRDFAGKFPVLADEESNFPLKWLPPESGRRERVS